MYHLFARMGLTDCLVNKRINRTVSLKKDAPGEITKTSLVWDSARKPNDQMFDE